MCVFLVNPSHVSLGTAAITPRWMCVLAAATPAHWATRSSATRRSIVGVESVTPEGLKDVYKGFNLFAAMPGLEIPVA